MAKTGTMFIFRTHYFVNNNYNDFDKSSIGMIDMKSKQLALELIFNIVFKNIFKIE